MLERLRLELEDAVRYHPVIRNVLGGLAMLRAGAPTPDPAKTRQQIERLTSAARLVTSSRLRESAEKRLALRVAGITNAADLRSMLPDYGDPGALSKSIVLKPYVSPREKGVLFVSFSTIWPRLARLARLKEFAERFDLVVAPSWSPPHSLAIYVAPAVYPGNIFTLISNPKDPEYFRAINPRYQVIPLYASSWVDPDRFVPLPFAEKTIDILMVANFGKFKRHHILFKTLRDLPRDLRVVLVGQDEPGRTADDIMREARIYGVQDRFELIQNLEYRRVCKLFGQAKISLILSLREGSCVCVTESMMADTPVGIFEGAELGSSVFLNAQTGRLLGASNLAPQIASFLGSAADYHPRRWALEAGIDCHNSSRILNDALKQEAFRTGAEWTCDLSPLRWEPNPQYAVEGDFGRFASSYRELRDDFGIDIRGFTDRVVATPH